MLFIGKLRRVVYREVETCCLSERKRATLFNEP